MKVVGVLAMVLVVGVLSLGFFFMANKGQGVNLGVKATNNVTVQGTVSSDNPAECAKSFYLGCYKLAASDGKNYLLVEDGGNVDFDLYLNQNVQLVGKVADVTGKNILMVSSVSR